MTTPTRNGFRRVALIVVAIAGIRACLGGAPAPAADDIVGRWSLDKDKALAAALERHTKVYGPPDAEARAEIRRMVDASYCNYEFRADGTVSIAYFMTPSSFGFEAGRWKIEDETIVVTTVDADGRSAARLYTYEDGLLVWDARPASLKWYLRRGAETAGS